SAGLRGNASAISSTCSRSRSARTGPDRSRRGLDLTRFDPEAMLRILADHSVQYVLIGGLAAPLHGSPLRTGDADICPSRRGENLTRLAAALRTMDARIRSPDAPAGLPFACDASFFRNVELVNLTTQFGDLDVAFVPAGTAGYDDL